MTQCAVWLAKTSVISARRRRPYCDTLFHQVKAFRHFTLVLVVCSQSPPELLKHHCFKESLSFPTFAYLLPVPLLHCKSCCPSYGVAVV